MVCCNKLRTFVSRFQHSPVRAFYVFFGPEGQRLAPPSATGPKVSVRLCFWRPKYEYSYKYDVSQMIFKDIRYVSLLMP